MGNIQPPTQIESRIEQVAVLGKAESNGSVGFYGNPHDLTGIAVNTRRDIDTDHRTTRVVDYINHFRIFTANLTSQARAEDRIHHGVTVRYAGCDLVHRIKRLNLNRHAVDDLPVQLRRSSILFRVS